MIYSILKTLALPPVSLFILILLGSLWWRRPLGRFVVTLSALLLLVLSLPIVSHRMMAPLEPYAALNGSDLTRTRAEAIVVLAAGRYTGAPEYGGDSIGATSLQRIRYAAWLQRETGLPLIVSGGSPTQKQAATGQLMRDVLVDEFQVPVAAVEDRSRNTRENAAFSADILQEMNLERILLVSSAWHLPRAVNAFERHGLTVVPAPTVFETRDSSDGLQADDFFPGVGSLHRSHLAIHEYLGRLWYGIRDRLE